MIDESLKKHKLSWKWWGKIIRTGWFWGRFSLFLLMVALIMPGPKTLDISRVGRIETELEGYSFNYVAWEVDALWQKAKQLLFGYHTYIDIAEGKTVVLEYLQTVGRLQDLEGKIEATYTSNDPQAGDLRKDLQTERNGIKNQLMTLQPIAEPIIEQQISSVLVDLGFGVGGQLLPPVKFRFVQPPDILVISPRAFIQQDYAYSLRPLSIAEQVEIEERVASASPSDSTRVTGIGGVGIYPAMVEETRYAAFAYEVVAHEWSHHYLFLFPNGQAYLVAPESRIINETTATVFGNAIGLLVLEKFWSDEVAQGQIYVPDYPTLSNFFPQPTNNPANPNMQGLLERPTPDNDVALYRTRLRTTADYLNALDRPQAAQDTLNIWGKVLRTLGVNLLDSDEVPSRGALINRTRITTDYLLSLGRIEAAENFMSVQGLRLGIRRMNQAWFAFFGGYQADPQSGGGTSLSGITDVLDPDFAGDPIGPAIQELFELSPTPFDFLMIMRNVSTRDELLTTLAETRQQQDVVSDSK